MGFLSFLSKKSPEDVAKKHLSRVADKRGYAPDRWDSLKALTDLAHPAAVPVLLQRFTFRVDPSITDQEEKELALRGVVAAGRDAVPAIRTFLASAESVTWAVKALAELLSPGEVVDELLAVLRATEVAYTKDPQRKIQLLMELEARSSEKVPGEVLRFLEDPNEDVRNHAVRVLEVQPPHEGVVPALLAMYEVEEGARGRAAVLDALIRHGYQFPSETAHLARAKAPNAYSIQADGRILRTA